MQNRKLVRKDRGGAFDARLEGIEELRRVNGWTEERQPRVSQWERLHSTSRSRSPERTLTSSTRGSPARHTATASPQIGGSLNTRRDIGGKSSEAKPPPFQSYFDKFEKLIRGSPKQKKADEEEMSARNANHPIPMCEGDVETEVEAAREMTRITCDLQKKHEKELREMSAVYESKLARMEHVVELYKV